jgi:hypothetical protein
LSVCSSNGACESEKCDMCMSGETELHVVHRSYREHVRRGARMRRIFPTIKHFTDQDLIARASDMNKISIKWFHALCRVNKEWC